MTYTKKLFGGELKKQLSTDCDVVRIARWSHREYLEHCGDFEPGLYEILMSVVAMEEGPEFELSEDELWKLVGELEQD